jgi:recombination protein RecA
MSTNNGNAERLKALDLAVGQIEKAHGKGSIMRLGDNAIQKIDVISTGSMAIDHCLGVGGIPRGRITEIYGPESSGKTTLALHVIAQAQKNGGYAAFVDAEHAFDAKYARNLGINTEEMLISQPDSGEQALEIAETLIRSGALDVVVIDSVAALVPRAELEGDMGDSHMGLQARLMSQALRKLTGVVNKTRTSVIFINQVREKIGVMFGNPETTTGGRALKFYSSVRLDIRRIGAIKKGDEVIGNRTKIKVVKNKVAPPFQEVEFNIMYGKGISRIAEILDMAVEHDIIEKRGSWFRYDGEPIGQGADAAMQFLEEDKDLCVKIEAIIRAKLFPEDDTQPKVTAKKSKSADTVDADD